MNYIKFALDLTLVPVYFSMVLIKGIIDAFCTAYWETVDAYRESKRAHFK